MSEPKVSTTQINGLITKYLKLYEAAFGAKPANFNRFAMKWGFRDMIQDLGYSRAGEVVDYYFQTRRKTYTAYDMLDNYGDINELMLEQAEDRINREKLRQQSAQRVKEWRERNGQ